ncbi:hypothetical protein COY25_00180 [Candidatus Uhrbacteria bacterium CG_4_10_14_0_2_um_filter_41_7]|uniref:Lipoprotein n=1 Tax=Candidatus Uhrbacteria bacterium CG_4_9_14_3_um_filter_41_35 TaxID=1975034 RepID=A0A2M7XFU0_9BACT|nr:MAG: hypothetical protein COV92_02865 [Candidatus Uhrbacteria bacterium CG11_big_fil_rev_8_21_14_0_20_41_9]PIZ55827.1 MAG: hypothetical protein COY25_00180 [Candidatus Uhrbacteria bacterium CG_4_10_14_0_2_um_filter_41_7]PJA46760.1 MAG: hypothetical protein CO173_01560 [Candidatus Uhrbacteria bacterium CG_4_9_14_3_um_filter_41_35]
MKYGLFLFAFLLIGAGCLGASKVAETTEVNEQNTKTTNEQSPQNNSINTQISTESPDVIEQVDGTETVETGETEEIFTSGFQMVPNPQPAKPFDRDQDFAETVTESQVLKLDLDGDGALEYAVIYTDTNVKSSEDTALTVQFLNIYKWNGEKWTPIKEDKIVRRGGDKNGWLNKYEVVNLGSGLHGLYVQKSYAGDPSTEYLFGKLDNGGFGELPHERYTQNQ